MDFVSLHGHSIYSIRDSIAKIPDIVSRSKALGHTAVALTDHGTAGGLFKLYKECLKQEIKPILGVEFYVANRSRFQKETGVDKYHHLILLAMNDVGWNNLCYLVNESNKPECKYRKPRIDREILRAHSDGLICTSACIAGHLPYTILAEQRFNFNDEEGNTSATAVNLTETAIEVAKWYKGVFGDRYYLEVQRHGIKAEDVVAERMFDISKKLGIKIIATTDSHYVMPEDRKAHDIMIAIRDKTTINDPNLKRYDGSGYHIMSGDEVYSKFNGHRELIDNTVEIAERCNVFLETGNFKLPKVLDVREEDDKFKEIVYDGLKQRIGDFDSVYADRLEHELRVIQQMTFPSYFLIVGDYVRWAKKNNIPIGPGRGSAAGSLVAYALNITDIDPIKYNTSFARFLNSGRASYPVVDFPEFKIEDWENGS